MGKIGLIIKREYLTRVKKKSFIVMTILGPLLMAGVYSTPYFLYKYAKDEKKLLVIDETQELASTFKKDKSITITQTSKSIEKAKEELWKGNADGLLVIPANTMENPSAPMLYSTQQMSMDVIEYVEDRLQQGIEDKKLLNSGIRKTTLDSIETKVSINTFKLTEEGEESSNSGSVTAAGIIFGLLTYMFVFIFGAQVMRGVIEEKTSRIVEVIVSSVKPFQLMMGKIVGIALVGLTQFLLWIFLTMGLVSGVSMMFKDKDSMKQQMEQVQEMAKESKQSGAAGITEVFAMADTLNLPLLLGAFLFYFLGGYLLYGALFAAIGSAVDSEADTQQFMLPITLPLIMSFIVAQYVIMNPSGPIAFWFSIIPLTSPVIMMVRMPFGVPAWEIALSMGLLVIGFLFATWLAGRIYRVGILMYGKKPSWAELGKWLFYKA